PITSWITPTETYRVNRRREYGENATSVRATTLGQAKIFTDAPTSHHAEDAEMEARVAAAQRSIEEYTERKRALGEEFKSATLRKRGLEEEGEALRKEKNDKQTARAQFNALPTKLEGVQRKIDEAQEKIDRVVAKRAEI
ncbi:Structural maintenance of chromosomes protein 5, partial [Teratosphaeriaceae sp. CCFEE 6253]